MKKGFTLIELLVVIAIIGILSSVVLASLRGANTNAANKAVKVSLGQVRSQMTLDYEIGSTYANLCNGTREVSILDNASQNGAGNITSDGCGSSANAWAAWSPLKVPEVSSGNTYTYWCVDSTNASKGLTATVAGTLVNGTTIVCP